MTQGMLDTIYGAVAVSGNTIAAMILCTLLTNLIMQHQKIEFRLFLAIVVFNLMQTLIEPITIVLDGKFFPGARTVMMALNSILYCGAFCMSDSWLCYCYVRSFGEGRLKRRRIYYPMIILPMGGMVLGVTANFFYPILFHIDPQTMRYVRDWGFMLWYGISYLYMVGGLVLSYRAGSANRYIMGSALRFLLPVFVASIMQFLCNGLSVLWVGAAIGSLSMYLSIQHEWGYLDVLSGLYNRQYLNHYLNNQFSQKRRGKLAGIMLDVDEFKQINDRFGHLSGDQAIVECSKLLRGCISKDGIAARFGGDEFVIITPVNAEQEAYQLMENIHKAAERFNRTTKYPFTLGFSIGVTFYQEGDTLESFVDRMDVAMYKQKLLHKRKTE